MLSLLQWEDKMRKWEFLSCILLHWWPNCSGVGSRRWLCTFRIAVTSCQFWDQDRVLRVTYPRHQERHPRQPHSPKSPTSTVFWDAKTCSNQPITWLGAVFCTIFCFVIFLGGHIVLIVYLVFRPRSPRFNVSSATLNTASIDAGSLLDAGLSVLAKLNQSKQESECRLQLPDHRSIPRKHSYC